MPSVVSLELFFVGSDLSLLSAPPACHRAVDNAVRTGLS